MITGANTQGISFRSTARVLHEERVHDSCLCLKGIEAL
jgi:hypothetical protein